MFIISFSKSAITNKVICNKFRHLYWMWTFLIGYATSQWSDHPIVFMNFSPDLILSDCPRPRHTNDKVNENEWGYLNEKEGCVYQEMICLQLRNVACESAEHRHWREQRDRFYFLKISCLKLNSIFSPGLLRPYIAWNGADEESPVNMPRHYSRWQDWQWLMLHRRTTASQSLRTNWVRDRYRLCPTHTRPPTSRPIFHLHYNCHWFQP